MSLAEAAERADLDLTHDREFHREAAQKAAAIRDAIQEFMLAGEKLARDLEQADALDRGRAHNPVRLVAASIAAEAEMTATSYLNKDAQRWLGAE